MSTLLPPACTQNIEQLQAKIPHGLTEVGFISCYGNAAHLEWIKLRPIINHRQSFNSSNFTQIVFLTPTNQPIRTRQFISGANINKNLLNQQPQSTVDWGYTTTTTIRLGLLGQTFPKQAPRSNPAYLPCCAFMNSTTPFN